MNTSLTLPNTIQMRPSRLTGLLVGVAILAGVTTWSVSQVTTDTHSSNAKSAVASSQSTATKAYVDGVVALDPAKRAAIYGNAVPTERSVQSVNAASPELQSVNLSPTQPSVQSVNAASPELQSVNVSPTPSYADAIAAVPREQLVAMFGYR